MKAGGRASPCKTRRSPTSSPRKTKEKTVSPSKTASLSPPVNTPVTSPSRVPTAIQKAIHPSPTESSVFTIWYAAQHGKCERVQSILDRQAVESIDVQEYRTKWSALHFSARFGQTETVQLLLDRGADPNLPDLTGNTPLHLSAGWGNLRCTVLLLEAGAYASLQNQKSETPLEIATALARHDQLRILQSWQPLERSAEDLQTRRASRASLSPEDLLSIRVAALQTLEQELLDETDSIVRQELHALVAKTQRHGDTDASHLTTLDRLCTAYRSSNRLNKALAVAERALTLAETLCGSDDLVTLTWLNNASELLCSLGRIEESEQYLAQAYRGYEACCGPSDAATLAVLENLAIVTVQQRRFPQAEPLLRVLLERLLGLYDGGWNDHILELHMQLGVVVVEQKRVVESQQIFHDCLRHASSAYGDLHVLSLGCVEQLGRCAFLLGEFEASEHLFTDSLRGSLAQTTPLHGAAHHRRLHNNLAMVAIARKSAAAVEQKLQDEQYRSYTGIDTSVPQGYTLSDNLPATSTCNVITT